MADPAAQLALIIGSLQRSQVVRVRTSFSRSRHPLTSRSTLMVRPAAVAQGKRSSHFSGQRVPIRAFIYMAMPPADRAAQMYDYAVTLPGEIQLVWPAAWGPGKVLFLLARYMTWPEVTLSIYRAPPPNHPILYPVLTGAEQVADLPGPKCHAFFTYFACALLSVTLTALTPHRVDGVEYLRSGELVRHEPPLALLMEEVILVLRTWALWSRHRVLLLCLAALFIAIWTAISYIISVVVAKTTSASLPPAHLGKHVDD